MQGQRFRCIVGLNVLDMVPLHQLRYYIRSADLLRLIKSIMEWASLLDTKLHNNHTGIVEIQQP